MWLIRPSSHQKSISNSIHVLINLLMVLTPIWHDLAASSKRSQALLQRQLLYDVIAERSHCMKLISHHLARAKDHSNVWLSHIYWHFNDFISKNCDHTVIWWDWREINSLVVRFPISQSRFCHIYSSLSTLHCK